MGKIIVFSGAGLSAESGISTFRDSNGLWENNKIEEICNHNLFSKNMEKVKKRIERGIINRETDKAYLNIKKVFKFYNERRVQLGTVEPNKIHKELAKLEEKYEVIHLTQNVDDLLERAGCKNVIHLHGNLKQIKCLKCKENIDLMGFKDYTTYNVNYEEVNFEEFRCRNCNSYLVKPDIVFFGELAINYFIMKKVFREVNEEDIILVIGTMGNVINISNYMSVTEGYKILNNLEKSPYIKEDYFNNILYGKGTENIDSIIEIIKNKLR
jgi:NAD-dependent deacetylase